MAQVYTKAFAEDKSMFIYIPSGVSNWQSLRGVVFS